MFLLMTDINRGVKYECSWYRSVSRSYNIFCLLDNLRERNNNLSRSTILNSSDIDSNRNLSVLLLEEQVNLSQVDTTLKIFILNQEGLGKRVRPQSSVLGESLLLNLSITYRDDCLLSSLEDTSCAVFCLCAGLGLTLYSRVVRSIRQAEQTCTSLKFRIGLDARIRNKEATLHETRGVSDESSFLDLCSSTRGVTNQNLTRDRVTSISTQCLSSEGTSVKVDPTQVGGVISNGGNISVSIRVVLMLIVGFQNTKRTLRSQTPDSFTHLERCAVCITVIVRVLSNLKKFRCNILGNVYAIKEGIETSLRLHLLSSELNVSRTHVLNVLNRYNSTTQRLLFDDRSDLITDTSSCLISSNSSEALRTSSTTLALTSRYLTGESNTTRPCGLPGTPLNRCNTVVVGIQSSAGGNKVALNSRTLKCGKRLGVYPVI